MEHPASKGDLDRMHNLVADWLQNDSLASGADAESGPDDTAIARRFLKRVRAAGFACEIVEVRRARAVEYEARWTHNGASFVGFKQPPPQDAPDKALLAGCAALLANDWCRQRLP